MSDNAMCSQHINGLHKGQIGVMTTTLLSCLAYRFATYWPLTFVRGVNDVGLKLPLPQFSRHLELLEEAFASQGSQGAVGVEKKGLVPCDKEQQYQGAKENNRKSQETPSGALVINCQKKVHLRSWQT